jgi:hypothetical protein
VLALERVRVITERDISDDDARLAGEASRAAVLKSLAGEGTLLRIELRLVGEDPRIALRTQRPGEEELARIVTRLVRLDAAADAPWTTRYLRLIADHPATVARKIAPHVGSELLPFKRRVRQLKELGLTESLEIGYQLSPRGQVVLDHLDILAR